jgi:hypothetical protein
MVTDRIRRNDREISLFGDGLSHYSSVAMMQATNIRDRNDFALLRQLNCTRIGSVLFQ